MTPQRLLTFTLALCGSSLFLQASTSFIQLPSEGPLVFPDSSVINIQGVNDSPILTLGGPATLSELYSIQLIPTGGTKSNGSVVVNDNVHLIQINSITVYSGAFPFSQTFTETVSGGNATFAAVAGTPFTMALTNGQFLTITPQADGNLATTPIVNATFFLSSTAPEPSSILLAGTALIGLTLFAVRHRRNLTEQSRIHG